MSQSSKDVLHNVLKSLQVCPTTTPWLRVDDSRADDPNPEQDTPLENLHFLNSEFEKCIVKLIKFFQGRQYSNSVSGDNGTTGLALEILLHPPAYTCEQAQKLCQKATMNSNNGGPLAMKNLFLKEKKTKKKRFYLISACVDTEIKFKEIKFAKQVSFASQEALLEKLGLLPGSVTPFGLLNDRAQLVGGTSKADEGKKASTETDVQSLGGEAVEDERNFISQNEV